MCWSKQACAWEQATCTRFICSLAGVWCVLVACTPAAHHVVLAVLLEVTCMHGACAVLVLWLCCLLSGYVSFLGCMHAVMEGGGVMQAQHAQRAVLQSYTAHPCSVLQS